MLVHLLKNDYPVGVRASSTRARIFGGVVTTVGVALCAEACQGPSRTLPPCATTVEFPALTGKTSVTVMAAGDIAKCSSDAHMQTATLVKSRTPDAVLALGDLAYPNGSIEEFVDCYGSSWGAFRSITRPAIGNHEYHAPNAGPYFAYFCGSAGEPFKGYYSFDIGPWHAVSLNSNCGSDGDLPSGTRESFGGCTADSPQARWLKEDLAKHRSQCTVAYWHHPRFSSSALHGNADFMRDMVAILDEAKVDLVLNGHVHSYERFEPQDADGRATARPGLREIVVGSGGGGLVAFGDARPNSGYRNNTDYGALELMLRSDGYTWSFLSTAGNMLDSGEDRCRKK
jgi:acid phosphatase type 7